MARVLVVYYSMTGVTRGVGEDIAEALGADLSEVFDARPRTGWSRYVQAGVESVCRGLPAIRWERDPSDYELVVLGSPAWAGTMASPMRSYLFVHGRRLHEVAVFCTMRGRGGAATLTDMKALCHAPQAPTFAASVAEIRRDGHRKELAAFTESLRRAAGMPVSAVA
jgi:flavodoxin